jgi:glycerophosphoryl diester phosphodiesterase
MARMVRPAARPQVIAHRGASGYECELTFAAFDLALAQGADALELDVRATADGEPVALHDATLLRTTGDPRRIDELAASVVSALEHPARPLALDAVLARYGRSTRYFVDLKDPDPSWEGRVLEALDRHGVADRATVQSFDLEALDRLHRLAPALPVTALYRTADSIGLDVEAIPPIAAAVGLWHGAVDAPLVARAHRRGLAVQPWTVDDAPEARRLIALGVDAIITNRPDVVAGIVRPVAPAGAAA